MLSEVRKFVSKIKRAENGCWEWRICALEKNGRVGRPMYSFNDGFRTRAHRASWIIFNGDIPLGLLVCHKCDNPKCANPDHLFLGTNSDNTQDCVRKKRFPLGEKRKNHKIKDCDIPKIFEMYKSGIPQHKIAPKFNVRQQHISRILNKKRRQSCSEGTQLHPFMVLQN